MTLNSVGEESRDAILTKIKWLMSLRLVIATFSLGTSALVQISTGQPYLDPQLKALYLIIGLIYTLNLLYVFFLKKAKLLRGLAYVQIGVDLLFISALINFTGGVGSVFSLFYYLSIIAASIILYRRGGIIVASASSFLYSLIALLESYQIIDPVAVFIENEFTNGASLLFNVVMNITAFFLVALLSSFLSEQVRQSNQALKIKEHDYRRLEVLYRNIIESIGSGLLTVDKKNKISFFNRAAEVITGHKLSRVYGVRLYDIFPKLQKAEGDSEHLKNYEGTRSRFEIPFNRTDGVLVHLGFSRSILKDSDGSVQGTVYAFQDVTRLKQMEEHVKLVDRLAAIGRLATGMAHEIRNPLASMSGSIQMLKETLQLDSANKRLMEIVLKETNRLDQLLSDFVLFTHPDDRKREWVDLNGIIDDTLQLLSYNPLKNGIEVEKNLQGAPMVEADSQQLKQVFWNLFINAVQAMGTEGTLTVSTRVMPYDSLHESRREHLDENIGREWTEIVIGDNGKGIPKSYLDKIFDPFFTTKDQGIGLGLAIVYSIVESYKGIIEVASEDMQGTRFAIYLPAVSHQ
jgi:two-component system sensor histidine kinase PilS (NtrC family)